MTTHNRRNIPHPVLATVFPDYREGTEFQGEVINIRESPEDHRLVVAVRYRLNEPALRELVQGGDAQFTTTAGSEAGRLRESFSTTQEQQEFTLDSRQYARRLELQQFITAAREISGFRSPSWTPQTARFLGGGITLPEGAILAIGQPSTAPLEETETLESCVVITPSNHLEFGEIDISLDQDLITILVSPEYKAELNRARSGERETYLWPSVYLQAIERAVRECLDPDHSGKRWAQVMRERVREEGIPTDDEGYFQTRSLLHAQRLMNRPMLRLTQEGEQ